MGSAACEVAVRFVASIGARAVVDPFCGLGSVLATANAHGLDAIGVELSKRRARRARTALHAAASTPPAREPAPGDAVSEDESSTDLE